MTMKQAEQIKRSFLQDYEAICRKHQTYVDIGWPEMETDEEPCIEVTIGDKHLKYHLETLSHAAPYIM